MSRSYRHTPISGNTTCRSEQDDKRVDNRIRRARARQNIVTERYEAAEVDQTGLPTWSRGKDGRGYWEKPRDQRPGRSRWGSRWTYAEHLIQWRAMMRK